MVQLSRSSTSPLHGRVQSGLRSEAATSTATSGDRTSHRSPSERGETSPASPTSTARESARFVSASSLLDERENAARGAKRRREDDDQDGEGARSDGADDSGGGGATAPSPAELAPEASDANSSSAPAPSLADLAQQQQQVSELLPRLVSIGETLGDRVKALETLLGSQQSSESAAAPLRVQVVARGPGSSADDRSSAAHALIAASLKNSAELLSREADLRLLLQSLEATAISEDPKVQIPDAAGQVLRKSKSVKLRFSDKTLDGTLLSEQQQEIDKAHRAYLLVVRDQLKSAKKVEADAVASKLEEEQQALLDKLEDVFETTPALPSEVKASEHSAALTASSNAWAARRLELLTKKKAARMKREAKKEQLAKAKLEKLQADQRGSVRTFVENVIDVKLAEQAGAEGSGEASSGDIDIDAQIEDLRSKAAEQQRIAASLEKQQKRKKASSSSSSKAKKSKQQQQQQQQQQKSKQQQQQQQQQKGASSSKNGKRAKGPPSSARANSGGKKKGARITARDGGRGGN